MSKPTVTVTTRNAKNIVDPRTVRRRLTRILKHLSLDRAELSCVLCDDTFIRNLNRDYRGKDRPTDVLSFAMNEGETVAGPQGVLGDIVVSVETAVRQAKQLGHSPLEEVTSLVIHGLLHLLGFDHQNRHDEKAMTAEAQTLVSLFPRRR